MRKQEALDLADYIVDTYPFVEVRYFDFIIADEAYVLLVEFPDGDEERIYSRREWDLYHEPEASAWKDWTTGRTSPTVSSIEQ